MVNAKIIFALILLSRNFFRTRRQLYSVVCLLAQVSNRIVMDRSYWTCITYRVATDYFQVGAQEQLIFRS